MATVLDIGLLGAFDFIFPVLFIFAVVFSLLQKFKWVSDAPAFNAIIAIVLAFVTLLSKTVVDIINFMLPWFTVAIIFLVLLVLLFQILGAKEETLQNAVKDPSVIWTIIGVAIVIALAAFGSVLGQSIGPYLDSDGNATIDGRGSVATGSFEQNITATLFHPKVLALVVLFGVAIFAIFLLTGTTAPK